MTQNASMPGNVCGIDHIGITSVTFTSGNAYQLALIFTGGRPRPKPL